MRKTKKDFSTTLEMLEYSKKYKVPIVGGRGYVININTAGDFLVVTSNGSNDSYLAHSSIYLTSLDLDWEAFDKWNSDFTDAKVGDEVWYKIVDCTIKGYIVRINDTAADGSKRCEGFDEYECMIKIVTDETPEPQYRPFANVEEFKPYRERFIKAKDANPTNITKKVLQYSDEGVTFADKYLYLYSSLLEKFVFEDDSPCGVLVNSTK